MDNWVDVGRSKLHDFRESQTLLILTKFIKKIIDIYNTECISYKNTFHNIF
jgi:hypothetical protein